MTVVVAVGDSIAFGVGDVNTAYGPQAWSGRVSRLISAVNVNLGMTGAVLRDVESRVPEVLAQGPDIVLVSIGGNDIVRGPFDQEEFGDRLAECLESFRSVGAEVVLLTVPDLSRMVQLPGLMGRALHARTHAVNTALLSAAERTSTIIVDRWHDPHTYQDTHLHVDRTHPSAAGFQYLAHRTLAALGLGVVLTPIVEDPAPRRRAIWIATSGLSWVIRRFPLVVRNVVTLLRARPQPGRDCTRCDALSGQQERVLTRPVMRHPAVVLRPVGDRKTLIPSSSSPQTWHVPSPALMSPSMAD